MAISAQWYTRAVTLDCADGHVGDMYANEGDANGRGIDLSLFDGKEPANTTGMSVYLAWGHEAGGEGLTPFSAVDAAHGRWRVLYPTAMQRSGTVLARIMVYLNGNRAAISGSKNFRIFVDVDPVDGSAALSDNDFSVFQQAVIDLNTAKANADKSTKAANDAAKKATDAAAGANAAEKSAAKATTDANTAAKSADEQADRASKAANDADTATAKAKEATGNAEKATTDAAAATKSATSAASQAQGAASNANAAASNALQIANSIASNGAGDGEVAALKESVDKLGNLAAELSGGYIVMDGTLYAPSAKATASGGTAAMKSASVSGEMASLT
ncbi:DUF2479 domain-containing protein [Eggerthella lenta]|uniref:BppU N-terminal domain-containing protein n=1 Tax=Eggerthella lenta (strain ATCC 25559 / DSM 2243 / CCUG 17323 / JCM 9979 / KCTC 3265 / NCTC 11813 / VPI 0255 / 1899 B) TaxID=479437 RepID=C8WM96_EGGLE|nr:hypothetical protein [Eggerthella lenta]ACV56591.1 hypothetical protein Elen_2640 [Eggerthella lenta DSM 2243]RDB85151.1 DUF2479 domain-containing protein [Eggerthella lenta]RDB87756.1 DUF2479 domain-containing protein [Eggerthella lenta]RDC10814.1 DUF2479 domain-containing protein [Eggerthella lenta]